MQLDPNMMDEESLPDEVKNLLEEVKAAKTAKVESIGKFVAKRRDEAVKGRRQSGIEDIWQGDEEYYEGLDEASADGKTGSWSKSPSTTGGLSRTPTKGNTRCTSFFNITRQFVESASARMGDILLPAGDWNFSVGPTPVQDQVNEAKLAPLLNPQQPQYDQGFGVQAQEIAKPQTPLEQQGQFSNTGLGDELKKKLQKEADEAAEREELKIRDWLIECSYHTEVRKVIEDAARVGTGILKGPIPVKVKCLRYKGQALEVDITTSPASKHVDYWDFFPDPACGENIHNGNYVLERDRLSTRQLKDLKGVPGYLSDQIDKVLDEGPNKKNYNDNGARQSREESGNLEDDKYEVWYYYGLIDKAGMSAMDVQITEAESGKDTLPAIVTLVNDTPIKAHINPLDTGEFPYDVMPWQRMAGTWTGIGVARQGRTAQDMMNAAGRAMMDNAGLSSGPMLIIRKGAIIPADGQWNVTARKVWLATEQSDVRSVADAFTSINIPMMQQELAAIIQLSEKMMENATGIFFIMQGQQGSAPDTVGGMELLHRNASAILRRQSRTFDERITEPHIRRYHDYCQLHGPDDCKGDRKIEAIGSTALVEREIQSMESMALLQLSVNPIFGLDPEKGMVEVLKTKRFIPEKWTMDQAKKDEQAKKQPMIPAIEIAKIRAQIDDKKILSTEKIAQMNGDHLAERVKVDMDRDTVYAQTMAERDRTTATIRIQELQIKRDLAMLEYSSKRNIALDQIKSELAATSMKLRVQKELAGLAQQENKTLRPEVPITPQVITPPTEPPQHAQDGRAFEQ